MNPRTDFNPLGLVNRTRRTFRLGPTAWVWVTFSLFYSALLALLIWGLVPEVFKGELVEPDNYMRLVHVEHIVERGQWFDNSIPRSNAPYGEELHWTRPLDILLIGGATLLRPVMPFKKGLFAAGVFISPLILFLICQVMAWAVIPVGGTRTRLPVAFMVLSQVGIIIYALPGRPDHHVLLTLCYAASVGLTLRMWIDPPRRRVAISAGAATALGLWVGPEFLISLGLVIACGSILWVLEGEDLAERNLWFSVGLAGTLSLALLIERPPSNWLVEEYDRLSIPHLFVGLISLGYWTLLVASRRAVGGLGSRKVRLIAGAVLGCVAVATLFAVFPRFFLGPTADIDPALWGLWRQFVGEDQGLLLPTTLAGVGHFLMFLGPSLFCIPFLAAVLWKDRCDPIWRVWLFLAISLVCFLWLSLYRVRFVAYPQLLLALVTMAVLARILPGVESRFRGLRRAAVSVMVSLALMLGFLGLGTALVAVAMGAAPGLRAAEVGESGSCRIMDIAPFLTDPNGLGDRPRTIVSDLQFGPELLYRTDHSVLATPYHRNSSGILASSAILASPDSALSRRLIIERDVDLLLLCPLIPSLFTEGYGGGQGNGSLSSRLIEGRMPSWLRRVDLQGEGETGFLLFQVESPG